MTSIKQTNQMYLNDGVTKILRIITIIVIIY